MLVQAEDIVYASLADEAITVIQDYSEFHQISVALFHQECAAYEITPQQYAVLRVLATHDGVDQITLAGLAAFNRTTAGNSSRGWNTPAC